MTWQGVSEAECYDNRSVIAQIVRIKDRLTAVEQNVDPTLRTDLEAAIAELTALENTVGNVETQVETNTGNIGDLQDDLEAFETSTTAALALKADSADVDADLELKADKTQLTDGSVTKIGTGTVGSDGTIVYLNAGVPTAGKSPLVTQGGVSGYFVPNQTIATVNEVMTRGCVRGSSAISSPSATNSDSDNNHVWVSFQYSLFSGDNAFEVGWQDLAIFAVEASPPRTSVRCGIVTVFNVDGTTSVDYSKKLLKGFDKMVMAKKDNKIYLCCRFPNKTARMCARHFAGPCVGSGFTSLDTTTTSTGANWYENIMYDGNDIPNFPNYSEYTWTVM